MSRLIGVNTLVFNEELQEGSKKQWEYLPELKQLGFAFVEVRREFLRNLEEELQETKQKAVEMKLPLFYSVPDVLFVDGKVNANLTRYFKEATQLGAVQVKLTLGEYSGFDATIVKGLRGILSLFSEVKLTVENDQSVAGGSAEPLSNFAAEAHQHDLPLALTFDTGNFVFIDEIPEEAARIMQDFVNYIHIKNVKRQEHNGIELALFDTGDVNINLVLDTFKKHVVAAIEYPCGDKETAMKILADQLQLIQSI